MSIAAVITTCNRPAALARTLPQVCALGWPVLVVDDGSDSRETAWAVEPMIIAQGSRPAVHFIELPTRRGLAAALTIGVTYWLADPAVEWISVFQDDVDVRPEAGTILEAFSTDPVRRPLLTGHDAAEHVEVDLCIEQGRRVKFKTNARATHLHAHRDYWMSVLPVPSRGLGAPHRIPGESRGLGSNVDWWIVRDAPQSVVATGGHILCLPGLVRTFLWRKEDSLWDNEQRAGADPEWT